MKKVLVTGAGGFIGRNLLVGLARIEDIEVYAYDIDNDPAELRTWLDTVDIVYHLAGVNRPKNVEDYETGNAGFTSEICDILRQLKRTPKIVMSSSIQAALDNPYGLSKRRAEEALQTFARESGAVVSIFRLKNVFGKWCRPEYNSVTATFCNNIGHDVPISISDPAREVELVYVDDVVARLIVELESPTGYDISTPDGIPAMRITLGDLAGRIQAFSEISNSLVIPDFSDHFNQCLYATYLSYLEPDRLEYTLTARSDPRGNLAEFVKSDHFGQVFISRTNPGVTRGNHYHDTKTEKFLVIAGEGLIRLRQIESDDIIEYHVRGEAYQVIDIPPGYTHSITNVGEDEMITLFWASEVFNPDRADTYYLEVGPAVEAKGR